MITELLRELNTFNLYHKNNTRLESNYQHRYALPFEKVDYPREYTEFLQKNWYHTLTISVVYYVLVHVLQFVMRARKPFKLKWILVFWNTALAIFSMVGFARMLEDYFYSLVNHGFYNSICYSCHPRSVAAYWSLLFAISKVIELGDTLFLVLRKKPLIFLHYYHHAAVLVYTVHAGAEHTAAGRIFIIMNYLAHSFMYTYYATTAANIKLPRWVAMCVTTVQTTQMLAGVAVTCLVYKWKTDYNWPCQQSLGNLYLAFFIYATFAVLFIRFYYQTYFVNRRERRKQE